MLIAMCNQPEDHVILADLCISVSESIGGLIDFGGPLPLAGTPHLGILHEVSLRRRRSGKSPTGCRHPPGILRLWRGRETPCFHRADSALPGPSEY